MAPRPTIKQDGLIIKNKSLLAPNNPVNFKDRRGIFHYLSISGIKVGFSIGTCANSGYELIVLS